MVIPVNKDHHNNHYYLTTAVTRLRQRHVFAVLAAHADRVLDVRVDGRLTELPRVHLHLVFLVLEAQLGQAVKQLRQVTSNLQCHHQTLPAKHRVTVSDVTRMWANAQRDGRPAEYRWRSLFNAAVWLTPTTRVQCSNASNAAKTRNPLKFAGVS